MSSSSSQSKRPPAASIHGEYDPYIYMRAPQPEGKKPEKYRFDLSLLFKDEKESCFEEARARSLGLLGKKWGPPAIESKRNLEIQQPVDAGSDGRSSNRNLSSNLNLTLSMTGEPTVTINTKAALNDVFGMYNSPDKPQKYSSLPGSKHAPIKKIAPLPEATPKANSIYSNLDESIMPPPKSESKSSLSHHLNKVATFCDSFPYFC